MATSYSITLFVIYRKQIQNSLSQWLSEKTTLANQLTILSFNIFLYYDLGLALIHIFT